MAKTIKVVYKTVLFILGVIFIILGLIGLMLPVIPQIPFLLAGAICLTRSSSRLRNWLFSHRLYQKHCKKYVEKHSFLRKLLGV